LARWFCLVDFSNEVVSDVLFFFDGLFEEMELFDLFEGRPCFWVLADHFDEELLKVL